MYHEIVIAILVLMLTYVINRYNRLRENYDELSKHHTTYIENMNKINNNVIELKESFARQQNGSDILKTMIDKYMESKGIDINPEQL
jgi:uncharacterized ion transporter superfamily protein YfcC